MTGRPPGHDFAWVIAAVHCLASEAGVTRIDGAHQ